MRRELQSFRSTVISEFAKYEGRVQQVEAQSLELHQTTKAHSEELSCVRSELSSISEHLVTPTNHETAIQALQAELAALRTQISSNSTALTVSGRPAHNPCMPADSSYDGKTQDGAAEFIRRIEVHSQQVSFSSDRAKILFAMGYLTGKASKWADPFVEDAEDAGSNWDEWRTLQHISNFRSIFNRLLPADKQTKLVHDILKDSLRDDIQKHLVGWRGTTAKELVDCLNEIEPVLKRLRQRKYIHSTQSTTNPSPIPTPIATYTPPPRRDPNAMDVDALQRLCEEKAKLRCKGRTPLSDFSPFEIPISLMVHGTVVSATARVVKTYAMVDTGASVPLINSRFIQEHKIPLTQKRRPVLLRTVDNSQVKSGMVTHDTMMRMVVGDHREDVHFDVADIGDDNIILGHAVIVHGSINQSRLPRKWFKPSPVWANQQIQLLEDK
ncbi:hypothetical protein C8R41DRAFT_864664 [Lentinula lateritia]|uniref:Retrotransposon gag domain-containing protein n=1 Tax=Lentinula lateritia TaxID=40482 RepID=A0ABQ8VPZ7_9AGAR|nr:hypothetical protein C8R41DRAFT_864664 [Lentinula lateritia]